MHDGMQERLRFHSKASLFPQTIKNLRLEADKDLSWREWCQGLFGLDELNTLQEQWQQVVVAVILGSGAIFFDCLCQVYLQLHVKKSNIVLDDIGFDMLPFWNSRTASDNVLKIISICTFTRFLILPGPLSMRLTILRRWFLCLGLLFFLRGISIISTVLPNPAKQCVSAVRQDDNLSYTEEAWYIATGRRQTCADVLYSGHTVNLTLCLLIWWNYSHLCPLSRGSKLLFPLGKYLTAVACFLAFIVIIMTHFHYTVDVFLGFWITFFVWNYYHEAIKSSKLYSGLFSNFLNWMEAGATDLGYWHSLMSCPPDPASCDEVRTLLLARNKMGGRHFDMEQQDASTERETLPIFSGSDKSAAIYGVCAFGTKEEKPLRSGGDSTSNSTSRGIFHSSRGQRLSLGEEGDLC